VEEQLTAQREIKRRWIESYVNDELRFTAAIANLPETTEATKAFIAAYREMRAETQANPAAAQADTVALEAWYRPKVLIAAKTYGSVFYDKLSPSIARGKW
jgi:hypothetical protein